MQDLMKKEKEIYNNNLNKIKNMDLSSIKKYEDYFTKSNKFISKLDSMLNNINEDYFANNSIEQLKEDNNKLYEELFASNYSSSYSNPVYCVELFGKQGKIFSYVYHQLRSLIPFIYNQKFDKLNKTLDLYINFYEEVNKDDSFENLNELIKEFSIDHAYSNYIDFVNVGYAHDYFNYTNILNESDLKDPKYLFKFGSYVSDDEIKTVEFLSNYDESKLEELSKSIANAYVEGFKRDNKDYTLRKHVRIICNLGQELITKKIIDHLKEFDLNGFIYNIETKELNKQYGYDHKFDLALYLNEHFIKHSNEEFKKACKTKEEVLKNYSGILFIERFGEVPFSPKSNDARITLNQEEQKFFQTMQQNRRVVIEEYVPETQRSFCIVAFPVYEIGDNFKEIFEDIIKINMLDVYKYEKIQTTLINTLDEAEFVHVKGSNTNKTDIKVKMHKLNNKEKETNFVNCVADVNIPLGEVFTSPVLKDTNGILHVEDIYLDGFRYLNLEIEFEDGYVKNYTCTNFEKEEDNKNYIKENLLFPHNTLPIGEFAIGTNTLAYVISKKYNILDKLPILIIEKMGPHFAIGDTCFSWSEDNKVYNPMDNKEIMAKDNERSILRKEDVSKAYTNCHTDITLPYDSLEKISAINYDNKEIDIIKDGRFVLEGTLELNEPFDK
ncbi:MAG: aminopeptidase [Peptostreptococcaceae bacterium]|jgi:leucyl aminopeptidase (aminopeptidase T)|nr:aminopeptidase [Peptostreptococcaceae bacterium]